MSKYNLEIKLQVVADYEAGSRSYKQLAEEYQIGKSDIKRWIHNYQDFGYKLCYCDNYYEMICSIRF